MTRNKTFGGRRPGPAALAATLLLAVLGPASRRAEAVYSIADLGNLGTAGPPSLAVGALNANGQVVGTYNGSLGFFASGGPMTAMGTLGGLYSFGTGINDKGVAVGYSYVTGNTSLDAFTFSNGTMTDVTAKLGITLGGTSTSPAAINNSGEIVGSASTDPNSASGGSTHAFLYNGTTTVDLGSLYGPNGQSKAYAINDAGLVVGNTNSVSGATHAFLYNGTAMRDLGTIGNSSGTSTAYDINRSGLVVGESGIGDGTTIHAFLSNGTTMVDLTAGAAYATFTSKAFGIDSAGDVVGFYNSGSFTGQHGFLYAGGTLLDLNSLLPSNSGWTITGAYGINDNGQIAAIGMNGQGQSHVLLLSAPTSLVPEPPAVALLCSGAALGLGLRKSSRRRGATAAAPSRSEGEG